MKASVSRPAGAAEPSDSFADSLTVSLAVSLAVSLVCSRCDAARDAAVGGIVAPGARRVRGAAAAADWVAMGAGGMGPPAGRLGRIGASGMSKSEDAELTFREPVGLRTIEPVSLRPARGGGGAGGGAGGGGGGGGAATSGERARVTFADPDMTRSVLSVRFGAAA